MSNDNRQQNQNSGENDQSPFVEFKFFSGLPIRTTESLSVILHRITSFLAGKEVVPSTLPGLAARAEARSTQRFPK
jgi:hypothetical protein